MIANPRDGQRVPDLALEQYRLHELPPDAAAAIERRLAAEPELRHRLDALDRSDVEIRGQYPEDWLAGRVRARVIERGAQLAKRVPSRARWMMPIALATAATMLILAIPSAVKRLQVSTPGAPGSALDDRIKGSPELAVYRKIAEGSEKLADGAAAHPGDLIRLGYRAAGRGYGVILSIDGRGGVTLHLPPNGGTAAALDRHGNAVLLDRAYELDDAPGWERFYFVTADAPFAADEVVDAARRAAAANPVSPPATLKVPHGFAQTSFTLNKDRRP